MSHKLCSLFDLYLVPASCIAFPYATWLKEFSISLSMALHVAQVFPRSHINQTLDPEMSCASNTTMQER